jgi:hypothetical protein
MTWAGFAVNACNNGRVLRSSEEAASTQNEGCTVGRTMEEQLSKTSKDSTVFSEGRLYYCVKEATSRFL